MIHEKISYVDFDGNAKTTDAYFNINKGELAELELVCPGGLRQHLVSITKNAKTNPAAVVDFLKDFIRRAYGIRSEDGEMFVKNPEVWDRFYFTNAYSEFFYSLVSDADRLAAFVNAVIPQSQAAKPAEIAEGIR